jgi:hypothetical protein
MGRVGVKQAYIATGTQKEAVMNEQGMNWRALTHTHMQEAVRAIKCAKVEAMGVDNGVGVVKLMGRNSGFITAHAALASRDVDVCLVPEVSIKAAPCPSGILTDAYITILD